MFRRWARLMGEEHWLTDPRFKDDEARGDHGEVISKRMAEWTAERTTDEALAELEKAKIPAGPLYSPQQALEDAHIRAAGLLRDTEYPGLPRPAPLAPTPVDLSETPGRFRSSRADARRAHGRDPRRARLLEGGDRRASRRERHLGGGVGPSTFSIPPTTLPVGVADDEAGVGLLDGPRRRELT